MNKLLATGILVSAVALGANSLKSKEFCGTEDIQNSSGKITLEILSKMTSQNVVKICVSHDSLSKGTLNLITDKDNHLTVDTVGENTSRITDAKNGTVITIVENSDGTFTTTDAPLIVKK